MVRPYKDSTSTVGFHITHYSLRGNMCQYPCYFVEKRIDLINTKSCCNKLQQDFSLRLLHYLFDLL